MAESATRRSGSATLQFVLTGYDRLQRATATLRSVLSTRGSRVGRSHERDRGRERDVRATGSTDPPSPGADRTPTSRDPAASNANSDQQSPEDGSAAERGRLTLVTPRARVVAAIEDGGDWTWQRTVVDELDLSASTVSRHVSALEDQGRVKRVSIGRQKVIGAPDADLDDIQPSDRCDAD